MADTVILYLALLDEPVFVRRPVTAERVDADRFRITSTLPDGKKWDPELEKWEFVPGTVVRAVTMLLGDGPNRREGLVAVALGT